MDEQHGLELFRTIADSYCLVASIERIAHCRGLPEHAWHEVDHMAAKKIFEIINDGRVYCLKVEKFESEYLSRLIQQPDYFQGVGHLGLPELSIGYRGSLSLVRTETYVHPAEKAMEIPPWVYRTPNWTEIREGIIQRLKEDFKPPKLAKWFVKNILARLLYMPDTNPEFWGVDAF